jgi:NADH dehydrogenase (ubiquinone) Fe-S protein 5
MSCYVIHGGENDGEGKKKCVPAMEDYYECLHHKKEVRHPRPRNGRSHSDTI